METPSEYRRHLACGGIRSFTRAMLIEVLRRGPQTLRPIPLHSQRRDDLMQTVLSGLRSDRGEWVASVARKVSQEREHALVIRNTGR